MLHAHDLRLRMASEYREHQIREAAEHHLGLLVAEGLAGDGLRRRLGRTLIRLGRALAAEPEPTFQPARPR